MEVVAFYGTSGQRGLLTAGRTISSAAGVRSTRTTADSPAAGHAGGAAGNFEVVVHRRSVAFARCAARAHYIDETSRSPLAEGLDFDQLATCLSALVTDRATEAWYHSSMHE
jgi:hypothetical protein